MKHTRLARGSGRFRRALPRHGCARRRSRRPRPPTGSRPARPGSAIRSSRSPATAATTSSHYALTLAYEPSTNQLAGTAVITATATQDLSQLRPRPARLRDLAPARERPAGAVHARRQQELVITPRDRAPIGLDVHGRRSTTPARRRSSPIRTGRSRAGSRPTTARSSSASRRGRRPGTRSTTTRATRRRTTSASPCPRG